MHLSSSLVKHGSRLRAVGMALLLILSAHALSLHASPDPIRSLWVGAQQHVIALDPGDGTALLDVPAHSLEDIAVDAIRGTVWIATKKELIAVDAAGRELFRQSHGHGQDRRKEQIKTGGHEHDDEHGDDIHGAEREAHLSLDPSDGSLWLATGNKVSRLALPFTLK